MVEEEEKAAECEWGGAAVCRRGICVGGEVLG
jgi:hypothetical protein